MMMTIKYTAYNSANRFIWLVNGFLLKIRHNTTKYSILTLFSFGLYHRTKRQQSKNDWLCFGEFLIRKRHITRHPDNDRRPLGNQLCQVPPWRSRSWLWRWPTLARCTEGISARTAFRQSANDNISLRTSRNFRYPRFRDHNWLRPCILTYGKSLREASRYKRQDLTTTNI